MKIKPTDTMTDRLPGFWTCAHCGGDFLLLDTSMLAKMAKHADECYLSKYEN